MSAAAILTLSAAMDDDLLRDLASPGAYPEPGPRSVALVSTHASWVFITDDEVWKVKRPVNHGFLDYSDAEKRLRCCEDEVRLGRRLAPEVYLGVRPVYRSADGYSFVGPGVVVDHAVRMRRLRDDESALALCRAGALTPEHLRRLAERLADFYATAPRTPELGAPAILAANIEENYRQTLPYADRFVDAAALARLCHAQEGALIAAEPWLLERLAEERIREGHGDLRLEHVYFPAENEGRPIVIDPIEFNRRFRCQDVALDVAFLAMELEAAGRGDLGAFFLSCFARASNDYGFYPVLDLYLSYRAWVRAKVACFVAADPGTPADKARRKGEEARRLFALAAACLGGGRSRPAVIAVGGVIGAGKSTLADALGLALGAPVVSSDATRKCLAGLRATERGDAALYTPAMTERTYAELHRRAELVLGSGRAVIVDASFQAAGARSAFRELAAQKSCPFLFVQVICDEPTLRARLRARCTGPSVSDAREDLLPRMLAAYEPPTELGAHEQIAVDGAAACDDAVGAVRQALRWPGERLARALQFSRA